MTTPKESPHTEGLDIANWTALRMRAMHRPIKEGLFMEGGQTPHQYLTKEIEALLAETKKDSEESNLGVAPVPERVAAHQPTEVDTPIVPNIDEGLRQFIEQEVNAVDVGC